MYYIIYTVNIGKNVLDLKEKRICLFVCSSSRVIPEIGNFNSHLTSSLKTL